MRELDDLNSTLKEIQNEKSWLERLLETILKVLGIDW